MTISIGEHVGPYRVTAQLGQGGMATVFRAYHANLDRYVAIKVLHPAFKEDETFFSRFKREAQIVARLEHPNIVPVYDYAETPEPYIVMKFIEGETLKHRLRRGELSLQETLRIMGAVASALTYAHQQGILHRDVKPSNVMLDKDGNPHLADFGLARIAASGESTVSQDVLIGTPHYISPEQARGMRDLGPETDVYSMGIMLYEIVVGRVPFSADTPYAVVHDHIYKPLPLPGAVNPSVPPQVETVLLKALSKEPADRYASADDLMAAFKQAIDESNLSELSAASIQMEKFEELARQADSQVSEAQLDSYIRTVAREYIQSELSSQPAVPAAYGATGSLQMGSTAAHRRARTRSRRNFWILSGFVALFCICIASLAVMINALQTPVLANQIKYEETSAAATNEMLLDEPTIIAAVPTSPIDRSITLEEAETYATENPADPYAQMLYAYALMQNGRTDEANVIVDMTLTELDPPAELIAQAAEVMESEGAYLEAIVFWLSAHSINPTDPAIRNGAGQYVYSQIVREDTRLSPETLQALNEQFSDLPLVKVMMAQALIDNTMRSGNEMPPARKRLIERLLQDALTIDDDFAEAYLVYGNYYDQAGNAAAAQDAWQTATRFPNVPRWVEREANRQLN